MLQSQNYGLAAMLDWTLTPNFRGSTAQGVGLAHTDKYLFNYQKSDFDLHSIACSMYKLCLLLPLAIVVYSGATTPCNTLTEDDWNYVMSKKASLPECEQVNFAAFTKSDVSIHCI